MQPGTKSPVTSNTAVAVEGITGNAEDNAYRRISRDQAADLIGTAGWDTATWKMMSGYDYPQLSWQTEELNNPTSQITDFITFTAKKSSDVYTGNAFTLSDFVNAATYSDGAATLHLHHRQGQRPARACGGPGCLYLHGCGYLHRHCLPPPWAAKPVKRA